MKNLIIIGARGFGRLMCSLIMQDNRYEKEFVVKGFLDSKSDALEGFEGYPSILSSVDDYKIEENDYFICALGEPKYRKQYADIIKNKGGKFYTYIHPSSIVHPNTKLGEGVIVSLFCHVANDCFIDDLTVIQGFATIGHDVKIGKNCSLQCYTFLGGFVEIGDNVMLHTRATILPSVKVGDNATVGAGSVCIKNIKPNSVVFGIPAKKLS